MDITKLNENELKSLSYDLTKQLNQLQRNLQLIEDQLRILQLLKEQNSAENKLS